nr:class I SAM-dependent methyltransferase [Natroniella acetigena]
MLDYWNGLAERFARWTEKERTKRRVDKVLNFLKDSNVLENKGKVLDIGAGPGTFTIPVAPSFSQITALEPASAMVDKLQEIAAEEGIDNIDYLTEKWENLEEEELVNTFDLVFASLTPGVNDVATLEKMINYSKEWCFLCQFAGRRKSLAREQLWELIFEEEMPSSGVDIMYPLNYLYTSGYSPRFEVWVDEWKEESTVEEAMTNLSRYFKLYIEVDDEVKKIISNYVTENSEGEIFYEEFKVRLGMILWSVNERWEF